MVDRNDFINKVRYMQRKHPLPPSQTEQLGLERIALNSPQTLEERVVTEWFDEEGE